MSHTVDYLTGLSGKGYGYAPADICIGASFIRNRIIANGSLPKKHRIA